MYSDLCSCVKTLLPKVLGFIHQNKRIEYKPIISTNLSGVSESIKAKKFYYKCIYCRCVHFIEIYHSIGSPLIFVRFFYKKNVKEGLKYSCTKYENLLENIQNKVFLNLEDKNITEIFYELTTDYPEIDFSLEFEKFKPLKKRKLAFNQPLYLYNN